MTTRLKWRKEGANVAILGATGAVGREMLHCVEALGLPVASLALLASARSAGKVVETFLGPCTVSDAHAFDFRGIDIVLSSAGKAVSLELADRIVAAGALMVDNTSAFRRAPQWPLVVPEVNGCEIKPEAGIIANPNCSTIQLVLSLKAIADVAGLRTVRVATYQSCSGAGQKGIDALLDETRAALDGKRPAKSAVHARTIAFDVVPQIGAFEDDGFTEEEHKMMFETKKILSAPTLRVSATCVRVPVVRSHSVSICLKTKEKISVERAREVIAAAPGVKLVDDLGALKYPMPLDTQNQDLVFVGRIRDDLTDERGLNAQNAFETYIGRVREDPADENGLIFWIVSDNLLKGAALNAVQIACAAWDHARMV